MYRVTKTLTVPGDDLRAKVPARSSRALSVGVAVCGYYLESAKVFFASSFERQYAKPDPSATLCCYAHIIAS